VLMAHGPLPPLLPASPTGIFFSSGEPWRAARQFTVRALHSLGVGQGPMADTVLQELACLSGQLDGYRGELGAGTPLRGTPRHLSPVCPSPGQPFPLALLGWAPSNITFALLFGRRFDYQDPVFVSLLGLIDEVMVLLGSPSIQVSGHCPARLCPCQAGERDPGSGPQGGRTFLGGGLSTVPPQPSPAALDMGQRLTSLTCDLRPALWEM
jgi:hypothetical protein